MIQRKSTVLAIIGQGYVGLPLAEAATRAGLSVIGLDTNEAVVEGLRGGRSHIDDLGDGQVRQMVENGYCATSDFKMLERVQYVVICVPTPLGDDGAPNIEFLQLASRAVAENLEPGSTVVLESTTYPGTTEEVVKPILESTGLKHGIDFYLAFSPERVDPGRRDYGIENTPKLVGGLTPTDTEKAAELYRQFVDEVVYMKGAREAETAKLLENTYRHVNIALVNEMARFCHDMGIDIWDVIRGAATKPFGFQRFTPGPGVGGHCIPIDPNYLSHHVKRTLGYPFRFVELAQEINTMMPQYVVQRAGDLLNEERIALNGSSVLLVGVTYKPDIRDQRESPAIPVAEGFLKKGAEVRYFDPFIDYWAASDLDLRSESDLYASAERADLVVLLQNHDVLDLERLVRSSRLLLDTRGATTASDVERI